MNDEARRLILRTIDKWEGGLVDDPDDSGGLTKYGVSHRWNPEIDIRTLTKDGAVDVLYLRYEKLNLDWINNVCLRWKVFDISVNTAPWRAAKYLQAIVGTKIDGWIGPVTLGAVNAREPRDVMYELIEKQARYYARIATVKGQGKFILGWIRRAFDKGEDLF